MDNLEDTSKVLCDMGSFSNAVNVSWVGENTISPQSSSLSSSSPGVAAEALIDCDCGRAGDGGTGEMGLTGFCTGLSMSNERRLDRAVMMDATGGRVPQPKLAIGEAEVGGVPALLGASEPPGNGISLGSSITLLREPIEDALRTER